MILQHLRVSESIKQAAAQESGRRFWGSPSDAGIWWPCPPYCIIGLVPEGMEGGSGVCYLERCPSCSSAQER